jgi:hypothetical protein
MFYAFSTKHQASILCYTKRIKTDESTKTDEKEAAATTAAEADRLQKEK